MKELAYSDVLLSQFEKDEQVFIVDEIYPVLKEKLKELVRQKHKEFPAPNSTQLEIKFTV